MLMEANARCRAILEKPIALSVACLWNWALGNAVEYGKSPSYLDYPCAFVPRSGFTIDELTDGSPQNTFRSFWFIIKVLKCKLNNGKQNQNEKELV